MISCQVSLGVKPLPGFPGLNLRLMNLAVAGLSQTEVMYVMEFENHLPGRTQKDICWLDRERH